ncbi:hypothetical protein AAG584_04195 [Vreelandella titanicae]|uniref:hypothetical protein n=1 Tax=Vreelandella titanicae TaxID=664683 RepID=UPI0031599AAA
MTATVFVASALMGAGKTRGFIERIKPEDNIVLAVPTISLGDDIVKAMKLAGVNYEVLNSDENSKGSTRSRIEYALTEGREGCVLVITQKALTMINADCLEGWRVVCDEVPDLNNCKISRKTPLSTYERLFKGLIQDHDDGIVSMKDGVSDTTLMDELDKSIVAGIEVATIMFAGLLERKAEVRLVLSDKDFLVTVADYHDYTKIIESCLSFHVMGNCVEKTLFYKFMVAKGCEIKESEYTPGPFKYKSSVTLIPLFNAERISRGILELNEEGSKAIKFDETCLGWKGMLKAVEYHKKEPVLVQCFHWMKKFPFDEHSNVIVTNFDTRGLNAYRNTHHRTINIFHGNPNPIQARLDIKMLSLMEVDIEIGISAIEHERFIEPMAQHIARTSIRNGLKGESIFVVLPTIGVAKKIEEALQLECEIDPSIMLDVPEKAPTQAKIKTAERDQKIVDLSAGGLTHEEIGKELGGISTKTVQRALKKAA